MSPAAAPSAARHLEMIEALTVCAGELAQVAARMAKAAEGDWPRFAAASREFHRGFFAVRMGARMIERLLTGKPLGRLRAEPRGETAETDPPEADGREIERPDWGREHERDRSEPTSLPLFLKSLRRMAASAEARKAELPPDIRNATLPRLHSLLAEADPEPKASAGVLLRSRPPSAAANPRARLLGGAAMPRPARPPPRRRDSS